jgi:RNA polymerase sigma-70 factor (ECF subfamily)
MVERKDEGSWIKQALDGDEESFARLVEAYQIPVYNLCYRMLGNPHEAEDAAQETFLRAYLGLHRYDPNRKFVTWILSIASHHCIDRLRKRRLPTLSFDELLPSQVKPDDAPGPEAVLMTLQNRDAIRVMLEALGDKDRAVLILRYWNDLSYEEIASAMTATVSAVKSRLHRARRQLALMWMDHETKVVAPKGKCDEASAI